MKITKIMMLLMCFSFTTYGQEKFEVTPNGLVDKNNNNNSFVVITTPDKNANELYSNVISYINSTYKNPNEVIVGKIENEYVKFKTFVPNAMRVKNGGAKVTCNMEYLTAVTVKDGKVKFEITSISIKSVIGNYEVMFIGNIWLSYPIYNIKNNKLRLPETKLDIENYFNTKVKVFTDYISNNVNTDF